MNAPGLFDLPTEAPLNLLDLPEELRDIIFKEVKMDDMKKNMPIEMEYDILMREAGLDMVKKKNRYTEGLQVLSNHMLSPDFMTTNFPLEARSFMIKMRKQNFENAKKLFYEVNNERSIFQNIVYGDVAIKARILKVENINRFFS
mgnify:CR=1 FL=1